MTLVKVKADRFHIALLALCLLLFCVVGVLIATSQYTIMGLVVFGIIVFIIFFLRPRYLVYYYLILGAIFPAGLFERIGGVVSITWTRTTILAVFYILYSLFFFRNIRYITKFREGRLFLTAIFPWIGYLGISILWSTSPIDSMRYYPKFVMAAFLALALLLDKRISSKQATDMLLMGASLFLVISTIAAPFKSVLWPGAWWPYFEGISGRHPSKFYVVFIAIFSLSCWVAGYKKKLSISLVLYSLILLTWILQRGAFLALIAGGLMLYLMSTEISFSSVRKGIAILGLAILGIYILFYTPRFTEHMFKLGKDPEQFFGYMFRGDISSAMNFINFKGRLTQWSAAEELGRSIFGKGFGSTPVYIASVFGRMNELHNDVLQYLIETGYLGFLLYALMWISMIRLGWKFRRSGDVLLRILSLSLGGYTVALFIWSFVDHVFDYTHMSGAYLFILVALVVKRIQELREHAKPS